MSKQVITASIIVDNPNTKRFNPSNNIFQGNKKDLYKFIDELLFDTFLETRGMKLIVEIHNA